MNGWDFVDNLTDDQIKDTEDEDLQQKIYQLFTGVLNDDYLAELPKVKQLLRIAGVVIHHKDAELADIERYGSELVGNAEHKISQLEQQLKEKQSLIDDLQNGGTGRDARYLRDELRTTEAENDKLKRELKDINAETGLTKEQLERITNEHMESKANNRALEGRCDQFRQDVLDLQKQLEAQREALILKRDGEEGRISRRLKDQEETRFINEIHELSEANEFLKDETERLVREIKESTVQYDKLCEDYNSVQSVIKETDNANTRLQEANEGMKLQVQDLQERLMDQGKSDNNVMLHVNAEIEKWRVLLNETESKLVNERKNNEALEQQLDSTRLDSNKRVLVELSQAVADKDKQIEDLQNELAEGYKQMQLMGEFVDELQASEPVRETNHLENQLTGYKNAAKAERDRMRRLEAESAQRDKEHAEVLVRIGQYENGTYGLYEAVQEIKDLKKQLNIRDKDITNMTTQINTLEGNLCTALDENEEMRRRLGLGPSDAIDLTELKFTKAAEQEQARAVNRLLSSEVDRLERERLELKKILRKQAMHRGVRAIELGLKTEDLEAIEEAAADAGWSANQSHIIQEELIEKLKQTKSHEVAATGELMKQVKELKMQNTKFSKTVDELTTKNTVLKVKIDKEKEERMKFENALKEALTSKGSTKLQDQPELYRLLSLLENRLEESYPDLTQHLKAQVSQLSGRNLELRSELSRTKEEIRRCERDRANAVADLAHFTPAGVPTNNIFVQHMGDRQSGVARQLIIVLQELEEKEETCKVMEKQVINAQDKLSRLTAQQALLYEEHYKLKVEFDSKASNESDNTSADSCQAYKMELERLHKVLELSADEQKTSLTETSRKLVLLKVRERIMKRELKSFCEREERSIREIKRLVILEECRTKETKERLAWLEQHKDTSAHHIHQLRDELLRCVPQKEVEKLYTTYTTITTKYRKLLDEESLVQTSAEKLSVLQDELNEGHGQLRECQKKLLVQEQRCKTLEERMLQRPTKDEPTTDMEDKLYNTELQLLNERQKASHALKKHSKLLTLTQELEERNAKLEENFTELAENNLVLQEREKALSSELESVTKLGAKDSRIQALETYVVELQTEVRRVQTVADISAHQTRTLLARRDQHAKELEQCHVTLQELEKQTDDKLTIGLLNGRLIEWQSKDIESNKLLEDFRIQHSQEQSKIMNLENKLVDEAKLQELHHHKVHAHVQLLTRTICYLRGQYAGAVPLHRQQRLGEAVRALIADKHELSQKIVKMEKINDSLEVELEHVRSETDKTQTLSSISKIRLSEMRLKRQVAQLTQHQTYLEKLAQDHEETIRDLEEENGGVYELLTEQRALDTSLLLQNSLRHPKPGNTKGPPAAEYLLCGRCRKGIEGDVEPSKLVSLEMDYLTAKLAKKDEKITKYTEEVDLLKTSLSKYHSKMSVLNATIDRLEEKLAMRNVDGVVPEEYATFQRSQTSAQHAIKALNERIEQKDGVIAKYQIMLKEVRDETKSYREKQERGLVRTNKEHSIKEQEWLMKYQELSAELQSLHEFGSAPTSHKRAELEELILEQDKSNASLRDNLFKLREEISDLKTERCVTAKHHEKTKAKLAADYERKLKKLHAELQQVDQKNIHILRENKPAQNETQKSPSKSRGANEKQKAELAEKEKEITQLKHALGAVKQEMTGLIESKMRENVNSVDNDVESLIKRETFKKDEELESFRALVAKLQKERDGALAEKAIIEAQLRDNPKLEKQLALQREKIVKLRADVAKSPAGNLHGDTVKESKRDSASSKPPSSVVDAWLEHKKWSKKLDTQKKQLEKKDKELGSLTKQNTGMRDTIERFERERTLLNTKLRNALRVSTKKEPAFTDTEIYTQELKNRIFDLEEERDVLRHDLTRDMSHPVTERDITISALRQTVSGLEKQLEELIVREYSPEILQQLDSLRGANLVQEKRAIEAEHGLLAQKLRAEHAELQLPRLRSRVSELQSYTNVLKPLSHSTRTTSAPDRGKSVVELERVINAMKRVIEKLQRDNTKQKAQIESLNKLHIQTPNGAAEMLTAEKAQTGELKKEKRALSEELDSRSLENVELKAEIATLKGSLKEVEIQRTESEKYINLEAQLVEERAVVENLKEEISRLKEDNSRKHNLLSEVRRRLMGVVEKEADLEEEIRMLHQCKIPNGAKEIAREAVRIKRQNAKLSQQLDALSKNLEPTLDPVFLEKLKDVKCENDVLVKKNVFYQIRLQELSVKYPEERISLEQTE